jgi:large subunit ribosomal protein L24
MQRAGQEAIKQLARKPPTTPQVVLENLLARNAYARQRRGKKHKEAEHKELMAEVRNDRQREARSNQVRGIVYKTAREQRHEDWEMGPLAPKRDVGQDWGPEYATVSGAYLEPPAMEHLEALTRIRNKGKEVQQGPWRKYEIYDRVVVIRGREMGKIGTIKKIKQFAGLVYVGGINTVGLPPLLPPHEPRC